MVFPYTLDSADNLVLVTLSGTVRGADIAETMEALYSDPAWRFGFESLWDGTNITELLFEKNDMNGFVALEQRYASVVGPGHVVLIVTRSLDEVMAHMYATMSRRMNRTVHVCKSLAEATEIVRRARA